MDEWAKKILKGLRTSFVLKIFMTNLKKNQVIIIFWVLLFGFLLFDWGKLFGIPYLFLDPEYHGHVDGRSLFIMGLAFGIFNMSFQITCYILDSERYLFLDKVKNPIFKFALYNSILPIVYVVVFVARFWNFQVERGLEYSAEAIRESLAFIGGFLYVLIITYLYFQIGSSKQMKWLSNKVDQKLRFFSFYRLAIWKRIRTIRHSILLDNKQHSESSASSGESIKLSNSEIYSQEVLFNSNHLAAVLLELATILILYLMGLFSEFAIFQIPAGASLYLFFGFILMFIGAISYWLRGWSISIFVGLAIVINFLFTQGWVSRSYQAFGIDYSKKLLYNTSQIKSYTDDVRYTADSLKTVGILNRWKAKTGKQKPQMILICTSGGGIRSATWTMRTLQYVDSSLNSELMSNTTLMTGASGGLLGAAYFRELYLQNYISHDVDYYERKYISNISKDILNPVVFSLITNDLLIRLRTFKDKHYTYNADRGLVFEQTLHHNLQNALKKKLHNYKNPENEAIIPMMLVAPVVVNDGRKLYISPLPVSYMCWDKNQSKSTPEFKLVRGVEWGRFFDSCDAMRLDFSSALRMNATFPYITPNVSLPTHPAIEVMDGGLGDNFGVSDALKFIHVFKGWIETETSGVILMCIRDTPKERPFRKQNNDSWFSRMINPLGSIYSNWARNQDYNNDLQEKYTRSCLTVPLNDLTFQYLAPTDLDENLDESKTEGRASLSWHLTTFEKQSVESSILHPKNQEALAKLKLLLSQTEDLK